MYVKVASRPVTSEVKSFKLIHSIIQLIVGIFLKENTEEM